MIFEHPWGTEFLREKVMQQVIGRWCLGMTRLDQCMVGLVDKSSGQPHLKPTVIVTNDRVLAQRLARRCDRQHEHQQLGGNNEYGSRCRQAETYPRKMASLIATVVMQFPNPEALVTLTEVDEIWTEALPGEEAAPAETENETEHQRAFRIWRSELVSEGPCPLGHT